MKTAAAAGMLPAGALWGYGSAGELRESGASILVERPLDLLAHLG
jgi:phosphoglycolate phosphatase